MDLQDKQILEAVVEVAATPARSALGRKRVEQVVQVLLSFRTLRHTPNL
jgi:hypothetical protein